MSETVVGTFEIKGLFDDLSRPPAVWSEQQERALARGWTRRITDGAGGGSWVAKKDKLVCGTFREPWGGPVEVAPGLAAQGYGPVQWRVLATDQVFSEEDDALRDALQAADEGRIGRPPRRRS